MTKRLKDLKTQTRVKETIIIIKKIKFAKKEKSL